MKISGVIYRLGRKADPWALPDWASAGPGGTFGNHFDDPEATYRMSPRRVSSRLLNL